ncbi:MAG: RsmG family class I SAM-dependent methyltransferase [Acidimicrobiales bacterium]
MEEVLERARALGFLGPGRVDRHVEHALGFAAAAGGPPERVLDLGSGGGLPGLVLALRWPHAAVALLDASERRAAFLREAVATLGLGERVTVLQARAEEAGRDGTWREQCDLVVARGFGRPAVTAECAAPLVAVGGAVVVSDPPSQATGPEGGPASGGEEDRWSTEGLEALGLAPRPPLRERGFTFRVIEKRYPCPPRYPRRNGIPAKRPLF